MRALQAAGRAKLARPLDRAEARQRDHATTSRSARGGRAVDLSDDRAVRALRATTCRAATSSRTRSRTSPAQLELPTVADEHPDGGAAVLEPRRRRRRRPRTPRRSGSKLKHEGAARRRQTTVTVLNGNGVAGLGRERVATCSASAATSPSLPPNGQPANAPTQDYFHTKIYYDPAQKRREGRGAAGRASLIGSRPTSSRCRRTSRCRARPRRDADGRRRHDLPRRARAGRRRRPTPKHAAAERPLRPGATALDLLQPLASRCPFPLSSPDGARAHLVPGHRLRRRAGAALLDRRAQHKAVRLVVPDRRQRVLGRSRRPTGRTRRCSPTRASGTPRRPRVRPLLHRLAPAHGRAARARRDATGSSTRCSTRSRTRRCSRSPRASNR